LTLCQLIITGSTKPKYVKLVEIGLIKGLGSWTMNNYLVIWTSSKPRSTIDWQSLGFICSHVWAIYFFHGQIFSWGSNAHLVIWKISICFKYLKFQAWALRWMGEVVNYHFLQALTFGPFPFVFIKNITNIFAVSRWCATMGRVFEDWGSTPPP